MKLVPLLIALILLAGCSLSARRESDPQTAIQPLVTTRAELTDVVERTEAGGLVHAMQTALVASRVVAPIAAMHVRPGDRVRRGQVLVTLDARDMDAAEAQAAAAASAAEDSVRASEADVRSADASVTLARATFDRVRALHERRSATSEELDQAASALATAEAQKESALARVAAARGASDAGRAASRAAAVVATYASLRAPFDGVVTQRQADPGSIAAPGAPLLTVENVRAFRLEVPLDESRAAGITIGQPVEVRIDAAPDAVLRATVGEIARVDSVSHTFVVKLDLPQERGLRSGLFGRASFAGAARRALTIPASALLRRGQLTFVYGIAENGAAVLRPVSLGAADGSRVEVLAGLREHDQIAARPGDVK
jgi:RND family efflux transporter MFP subunit